MRDKRWLILTEYFYPDTASGTGRIMTELAEDLVTKGFVVSVVCGQPSYGVRQRAAHHEKWKDIDITRLGQLHVSRHVPLGRMAEWVWFLLQCVVRLPIWRRQYRHMLVVTNPSPAPIIARLFKWGRDARYVVLIHDVFPENAVAVGKLRARAPMTRTMRSLNRVAFQAADSVVTVGDGMKRLLCTDYDLPEAKVKVIPNWASQTESETVVDREVIDYWRSSLGLEGRFLIVYAGNFGFAQDADLLIDCLRACRDMADVLFCFVGDGGQYDRLRLEELSGTMPNLRVLPFQAGARYTSLLRIAGCGLVSLHPLLAGMAVPSKAVGYMAAGLPVICVAGENADLFDMIVKTGSGIMCQTPAEFATAVQRLRSDTGLRSQMAQNALGAAEKRFSRAACTGAFAIILAQVS